MGFRTNKKEWFNNNKLLVGGRKLEFIKDYPGILILDIDKLSPEQLKQTSIKANQCEYTFASFISPSGNGLKILVKVNSDKANHKEAFLKVQAFYEALLGLQIDKSGKDITRLCFYSYDAELYLNEAAIIFKVVSKEDLTEYIQPYLTQEEKKVAQQNDIHNSKFIIQNFEVVYQHCIKFTEKKVQYTSGSRNTFVHQLACNLNRKAVPLQVALGYILADYNFDEKEVTQAVNSAYGNLSEYGKSNKNNTIVENLENQINPDNLGSDSEDEDKPKPTIIDRLETFLSNKYIIRHNIFQVNLNTKPI